MSNTDVIECSELETKSVRYKSFKVTLTENDRDKLLVHEYWPVGIVVRKFFNPRVRNNSQF